MAKSEGPISEESADLLKDVAKGKSRKFVLLCKGATITSLVVFKKGSYERYVTEARSSGSGQVFFGVVDGKGKNLNFKLARSDGFEKEPTRTAVLKQFLADNAAMSVMPLFEIVDVAPLVLDADNPLVARFLKLQEAVLAACEKFPESASAISTLCRQAGSYLDQDQTKEATSRIEDLESLLSKLGPSESPPAAPPKPTEPTATTSGPDMGSFTERLKALKPAIGDAIAAGGPKADEIKLRVSEAGVFARKNDFTQAMRLLDQVEKLLQGTGSQPPPTSTANASVAFANRLKEFKPDLDKALALPAAAETNLKELMANVRDAAGKKDFTAALEALEQAAAVVTKLLGPASEIPEGIVAKRSFLLTRWKQIPLDVREQVREIQQAMAAALPDVDSQALGAAIDDYVTGLLEQVQDEIDASIQSGDSSSIRGMKQRILGDALFHELIDNPFTDGDKIQEVIEVALDEVETALAG